MAHTLTITATKPANSQWFLDVHPDIAAKIAEFNRTYPGMTGSVRNTIDPNTVESIYTFDTLENMAKYRADMVNNPAIIERKKFNSENGIVYTVTENSI